MVNTLSPATTSTLDVPSPPDTVATAVSPSPPDTTANAETKTVEEMQIKIEMLEEERDFWKRKYQESKRKKAVIDV